jgi:hypothetical protein
MANLGGRVVRPAQLLRAGLMLALLAGAGCSSNNKGKIEGTRWASIATTSHGRPVEEGYLTLDFDTDKTLVLKRGKQIYKGTYSLGMGDQVTFNLDEDYRGRKTLVKKIAIDGDQLTLSDSVETISFKKRR